MKRTKDAAMTVQVAITPMLDMTFQLLFFFILSYNPSVLTEGQMSMALPAENKEAAAASPDQATKPNDVDDESTLPADLVLLLKTQNDGSNNGILSEVTLNERGVPQPVKTLDELSATLKRIKETEHLDNAEDITLKPDSRLSWGEVMKVMDVCDKAKFHVGFGAPPDRGAGQ